MRRRPPLRVHGERSKTVNKTSVWACEESRVEHGGFAFLRKRLGAAAGSQTIGISWFELQPGKKAFPFHYHLANEEALFVLEGAGGLQLCDEEQNERQDPHNPLDPRPSRQHASECSAETLHYL